MRGNTCVVQEDLLLVQRREARAGVMDVKNHCNLVLEYTVGIVMIVKEQMEAEVCL